MKVGDPVTLVIETLPKEQSKEGDHHVQRVTLRGKVFYIHPRRRYYTAEFVIGKERFRESFYFRNRAGAPPVRREGNDNNEKML